MDISYRSVSVSDECYYRRVNFAKAAQERETYYDLQTVVLGPALKHEVI